MFAETVPATTPSGAEVLAQLLPVFAIGLVIVVVFGYLVARIGRPPIHSVGRRIGGAHAGPGQARLAHDTLGRDELELPTMVIHAARRIGPRVRVAGLVLGLVMAGCATSIPTPSPSASTSPPAGTASPAPSPTASATPSSSSTSPLVPVLTSPPPSATADGWQAVPQQASVQGVQFQDVVWTGSRFVATGGALDGGGAILDSTDGITWNRQPDSTADGFPVRLAAGPRGVVAVGTFKGSWSAWWSPDGLKWTIRVGAFSTTGLGTDVIKVTAVVATDDGWLAVGRRDPLCQLDCGLTPVRAMVWTSGDGLHWKRVADQASFSKAAMTGVARLGSGFVAVGQAKGRAVVWTSSRGSTWTRVADDQIFHPRSSSDPTSWIVMTGASAGHGVVVAVGRDAASSCTDTCDSSVRAWWSADGRTWSKATGDRFAQGQAFSVTATPEGFIATGPSGADSCLGGIWSSTDGRAWRCIAADPAFEGFGPYAAAASSTVEVAVGLGGGSADPPDSGFPGAVWWRAVP